MFKLSIRLIFCLVVSAFMLLRLPEMRGGMAAAQSPPGSPLQPLLAWAMAGDGSLFVLDAGYRVFHLAPDTLLPLARSEPLAAAFGAYPASSSEQPAGLAVAESRLFVSGGALTQTLLLNRDTFAVVEQLPHSGPVAVDPGRRLFVIGDAQIPDTTYPTRALWVYDLSNLKRPPTQLVEPSLSGAPVGLLAAPQTGRLYVTMFNTPGSAPRHSASINLYNLDDLSQLATLSDTRHGFAFLSRPAVAPQSGRIFSTARYSSPLEPGKLLIFNTKGDLLDQAEALSGLPATDAAGDRIYLLQSRGLWVLRGSDMALQAVLPFTAHPPHDLLLSPSGDTLYLLGNGWLTALPTAELHALGLPLVSPLPAAWQNIPGEPFTLYKTGAVQFAAVGPHIYRAEGESNRWQLLPAFTYPAYVGMRALSISPDYGDDRTLVARSWSGLYRSTDGGDTLAPWTPRIAFTSDRDGQRDIYTMGPDGQDVQQITNHPANDELPAWSPAWSRLAFQSDRNGNWDIYTVRAGCRPQQSTANCDLKQLTANAGDNMQPAWSPDGRFIAFVSTRDGNPEIYLMAADGQNQYRLTFNEGGDWRPAWRPNSQELVFASDRNGNNDIYQISAPTSLEWPARAEPPVTRLTTDPADDRDPAVSDTDILFLSDRDGLARAYRFGLGSPEFVYPLAETAQPEAHPSRHALESQYLVARPEENGRSNIFKIEAGQYTPLTNSPHFNGHPAGGPVWWQPKP